MSSRRHIPRQAAALLLAALLGACGFQPLYGPGWNSDGAQELASIRISPIADRRGQILRNELMDRLTPLGTPATPAYTLVVNLTETTENLSVRRDDTATRANLILTANFKLTKLASDEVVILGSSETVNSFNISEFQFATLSAESDARRRAARELAVDIATRLTLAFKRAQAGDAAL